jgi:ELP3 family radical SAM enzyme/protein acetyltransferase
MSCSGIINDIEYVNIGNNIGSITVEEEPVKTYKNHKVPDENHMKVFIDDLITNNLNVKSDILDDIVRIVKKKHRIFPSKADIRTILDKHYKAVEIPLIFKRWLIKKNVRSNSGVLVATITLSPGGFSCMYDCAYCPQEMNLMGNPTQPRSYLSNEPAMLRALQFNFDVKGQFWDRIRAYTYTGNIVKDKTSCYKMEVILSGGTWESYQKEYREQVIKELYWAANTYGNDRDSKPLEDEVKENETSTYRIIGLTIETRPDNITDESLRDYRRWGVTRVQIGVQHYDDTILKKLNRKCYTKDTIRAIRLLKQCGFKVVVHLMPDLPGSSPELDMWMFNQVLERPELMFDDVKLYPTAVCKSSNENLIVKSKIADWYKEGSFVPYGEKNLDDLVNVLIYFKERIPPWIRIQRLVRDIPSTGIQAGYHAMTNLRQYIQNRMVKENKKCRCIRCMEIGEMELDDHTPRLVVRKYEASEGIEYHISIEAHKMNYLTFLHYYSYFVYAYLNWFLTGYWMYWSGNLESYIGLYGFLRLRIDPNPGGDIIPEINNCALIREVHVYGQSLGVGKDGFGSQHRGFGMWMMKVAEDIGSMHGFNKSAVIAGVGTREYYKNKCGYTLGDTYMLKKVNKYNFHFFIRMNITIGIIAILFGYNYFINI